MKVSLLFTSLWLAIASFFTPVDPSFLSGKISDGDGPLVGATVKVFNGTNLVRGVITDLDGTYKISLDPGTYMVEITYTGYQTLRYPEVNLLAGKTYTLDATMSNSVLSEVVITSYKVPLIEKDKISGGQTISSDALTALPTRKEMKRVEKSESRAAKKSAPAASSPKPAVYAPASGEAKPMPAAAPPAERAAMDEDIELAKVETGAVMMRDEEITSGIVAEGKAESGIISQPAPRAGLLTAGEWNDLHNWNLHWTDLLADGEITQYENIYGFYAHQRYAVLLTNERDFPLADVVVQLKSGADILWEARTDNTGKAELWAGLYDQKTASNLSVEAWVNGKKHSLGTPKPAKEGYNFHKIKAECFAPTNVDIVWAVDATGSMGDEIEYLKTEALDVISRVKSNNPTLNIRMGTTFYRDRGDEYTTKASGLSSDINRTVDFIREQFAGGGGDYPEAVDAALEDVVNNHKWSENAIARICFLVLDASPHQTPEVNASLQKSIREAARRGIRIVPIAASGVQKDTEFLMKFFGLATNGTYVFLTDHSGIGGKHLEPTTDEYKVEPLNDLLVRVITEYTSIETCEGKSNIRFEDDPQQQPGAILEATYYPNPAVDQFTLELPFEVQSVTLYNSEGKGVRKLEKPQAGVNIIRVDDLAPGFYTIRILNNDRMQSGKLMVVKRY